MYVLSSPESKAQVSFSDHNLSVVRPRCRKLFPFSFSSPEPLDQFQPNLVKSLLWLRGFKFFQMKEHAFFHVEIITKEWKYIDEIKKSTSPESPGQFQPNLRKAFLVKEIQVCLYEGPRPFLRGDNNKIA